MPLDTKSTSSVRMMVSMILAALIIVVEEQTQFASTEVGKGDAGAFRQHASKSRIVGSPNLICKERVRQAVQA